MVSDFRKLQVWMKPHAVSTMLSPWVWDLLPKEGANDLVKAAVAVGTGLAERIKIGQVSHEAGARIVQFGIKSPSFARAISNFGHDCCMVSRASILRTAAMIGLGLPKVELGVMSCTRKFPLTDEEIRRITEQARILFTGEFT